MNEIRSTNSSRAKYIPMNRAATAPMYLDDGRGSSAHVFLRTVDDNVVVFTVKFLLISSIFSCKDCEDSCSNSKQVHPISTNTTNLLI